MGMGFRTLALPRACVWAAAVAIVCIMGLAARGAAQAASRGTAANGLILFQAHVGRYNQLFTIKPDGTGLKQVTKIPFTGDTDGAEQADWSPDGQTIAFDAPSLKGGDTFINLFTVARDGSGLAELALALPGFNGAPSYSPDGTKIAFDQDAGPSRPNVHGIFVANADGSDPRRLVTGLATPDAYDTNTDWSPDGTRISFTRVKNQQRGSDLRRACRRQRLEATDAVAPRRRERRLVAGWIEAALPQLLQHAARQVAEHLHDATGGRTNDPAHPFHGRRHPGARAFVVAGREDDRLAQGQLEGQPVVPDGRARRPPAKADEPRSSGRQSESRRLGYRRRSTLGEQRPPDIVTRSRSPYRGRRLLLAADPRRESPPAT